MTHIRGNRDRSRRSDSHSIRWGTAWPDSTDTCRCCSSRSSRQWSAQRPQKSSSQGFQGVGQSLFGIGVQIGVHPNPGVEQPHMDATGALVIAAEPVGIQNELKIRPSASAALMAPNRKLVRSIVTAPSPARQAAA